MILTSVLVRSTVCWPIKTAMPKPKVQAKLVWRDRLFGLDIAFWHSFVSVDIVPVVERKVLKALADKDS